MRSIWRLRILIIIGVFMPWATLAITGGIPPVPADGYYIQDYAGLITRGIMTDIGQIQRVAYEQHQTPIVIVTIPSMTAYGSQGPIEQFAQQWFAAWGIGKRNANGSLRNQGILILVARDDRQARIELGADWGTSAETYSRSVMDNVMVPLFAKGEYGVGLVEGMTALAKLAAVGPGGAPPAMPKKSLSPTWWRDWIQQHWWEVGIGGVAVVLTGWRGLRRGGPGGYSAGGGFGTGGFSRGGGATGKW